MASRPTSQRSDTNTGGTNGKPQQRGHRKRKKQARQTKQRGCPLADTRGASFLKPPPPLFSWQPGFGYAGAKIVRAPRQETRLWRRRFVREHLPLPPTPLFALSHTLEDTIRRRYDAPRCAGGQSTIALAQLSPPSGHTDSYSSAQNGAQKL
ncbi:hypothetical protein MRX96_036830 [Rhipicephalus microplus]